jgi:hypothetical protein
VPESVLEAIKQGIWNYEPPQVDRGQFRSTQAVPGSEEKLAILAERVRMGLPLWHPSDRNHSIDSLDEN